MCGVERRIGVPRKEPIPLLQQDQPSESSYFGFYGRCVAHDWVVVCAMYRVIVHLVAGHAVYHVHCIVRGWQWCVGCGL